ncbi:Ribonuclease P protein component [Candidatus Thermoflexus japonica]|uniref:Ribonuclease P protein component n=1 Tax=Candidatus Thermoflexus japonica TaxID=2035417 RepID=A0A2H5Y8N1_9CHLR|nr:Ribonuclease P protein component [Candidatus Thermoflexus japonica]
MASLVRLRHRKAIERVLQEGRSWSNALLKLKAAPNDLGVTRVAVIAGRRAIGKAVRRNRAKRLLREAARLHLHEIQPGWDLVLIARPGLIGRKRQDAEAALREALARLGLLRESHPLPGDGAS